MLKKIEIFFDKFNIILGKILAFILILMILNVFYDVVMRYFFHNSSVGMQELEWHLFSLVILFGMSYSLLEEGHVRVDFVYENLSKRKKAYINIFGTLFFIVPLAILVAFGSFEFVNDAYISNEISEDPGGLHYRWIIKSMIPIAFFTLIFTSIGYMIKNINIIKEAT